MFIFLSYFLLLLVKSFECIKKYDGYNLYQSIPQTSEHLELLKSMKDFLMVNFWRPPTSVFYPTEFLLNRTSRKKFLDAAEKINLNMTKLTSNIGSLFENQKVKKKYLRDHPRTLMFYQYYEPDDIDGFLVDVAKEFPEKIEYLNIGKSVLGRDIVVLEVNKNIEGPGVVVEAGMHGNEWMSISFALFLIRELVLRDQKNDDFALFSTKYHWYIIPVANPDGFVYTHVEDRLWRKNRNMDPVDLNRNFDIFHGKHQSSHYRPNPNYCGRAPFSEPETQAIKRFLEEKSKNIKYYFSIHAYGQQIVIPQIGQTEHQDKMENIGKLAAENMKYIDNAIYKTGKTEKITGAKISGNSANWVKAKLQIEYVFTFKLRDDGKYGYALPPEQVFKGCQEALEGIKCILTYKEPLETKRIVRAAITSSSIKTRKSFNYVLFWIVFLLF